MGTYFAYYLTGFIMIPVFIFALICQSRVKSSYNKYSKVFNRNGLTGAQAAQRLLMLNGVTNVRIVPINGTLTDHFNPKTNEICLSQGVYNSPSIAAVGIACHEAGHACQHAQGYSPLRLRNAIISVTNIGTYAGVPLALIGMFLNSDLLIYIGLILYSTIVVFQLLTLPVEFDASKRALQTIQSNAFLTNDEYVGAKKVLTAAALTYVAALASALASLLRLLLVVSGRRRR